jgi:hypothetical protein
MAGTAGPMPFNAAFPEEVPTGRIDPLLVAHAPEQRFGKGQFGQTRPTRHKQIDIIGQRHFSNVANVAGRDRVHWDAALASINFAAHALASS